MSSDSLSLSKVILLTDFIANMRWGAQNRNPESALSQMLDWSLTWFQSYKNVFEYIHNLLNEFGNALAQRLNQFKGAVNLINLKIDKPVKTLWHIGQMILQCQVFKIIKIPMLKTLVNSSLTCSKTVVTAASRVKNIAGNHVNSSFPSRVTNSKTRLMAVPWPK